MGLIDFIRAKAKLAVNVNAIRPPSVSNKSILKWKTAIHPLLFLSFKSEDKKVVPLDVQITEKNRIVLISGPNAGGKSVCLKTVSLLQYMFQCGMLIPLHQSSEMGVFDKLFIDIGDEQSIENDLSTYSSHLLNMKYFVENADEKTLILIDEFGTGTEPMLGGAIAEAILEELNEQKVKGVITTHYTNLKHFASAVDGIVNGAMLYDNSKMKPLYKLEIGKPGSSFAFEIAGNIGLPEYIIEMASEKIGQKHIDFDKYLKEIEQDKLDLEEQKKKLTGLENQLESTIDKYNKEIDFALKQRKNILNVTKEQAEDILSKANKQIENTIFEIKKEQAEKAKTKDVRKELEKFKEEFAEKQKQELEKIESKIERIKEKKKRPKRKKQSVPKTEEVIDKTIHIGDSVKIKKQDAVGEVLDIKGNKITVAFGGMHTTVKKERLEKISKNNAKQYEKKTKPTLQSIGWEPSKKSSDFLFSLDVRGKRADEAVQIVSRHVDEAVISQASEIRILHGTGSGILRQILRDYLNAMDFVKSCRDEKIEFGGAGITIVTLEY